jgi:hypothetical protein
MLLKSVSGSSWSPARNIFDVRIGRRSVSWIVDFVVVQQHCLC